MKLLRSISLLALALADTSCKKSAPTTPNYAAAINAYYQAHPFCLWPEEKRFPVQAATSDEGKTQGYDALVDQGLLTRTTSEKHILIISRQQNNYDISPQGRPAWSADANQPGFGNFCFGHRRVSTVDSNTPTSDQPGATVTVNYHYTLADVPAWANAAETRTAFPRVEAALAGPQAATATLTNTSQGWQVSSHDPESSNRASPADGRIVQ
ncbi:MAG: hypothetical protein M3O02_01495 [Acidobacteriota bacterium]|nr:hypothetical protein [Acidobacteriota bacterium]